ncbi:LOW QUALITY PROTEIN: tripartite motif-containing protein 16-like [Lates calcarifer]|uniref:LOW QUALITY PROTEIN: tripartite motif-containing protein 16-like n=1 Tax=Lates calcarifer TaxID=8187 RepID=A0AAJ7LWU3_LATCA|nr:LOW QUALITY PROTEIN: tripartite motif-containing protein 16-like [Lates calcarifer]
MAEQGYQPQEEICCSICLDLLTDPVTVPCGHNYCMSCIQSHWNEEDRKKVYSCPQCRKTFIPRPVLMKNTMLAGLVEEMKRTRLQAAPADHCYAGPEDVACDACTGRKLKALKSCLVCLVSYCEQHLQPHLKSSAFENHKLVDPSKKLKQNICSQHNEVMKIFCRTDQKCICYLCSMNEHRHHKTVAAEEERTERQKELEASLQINQQRIQTREGEVKALQQEVEAISRSADKAVKDSEAIVTELIRVIQEKSSDLKQQIKNQQMHEVSRVKELQEKLEQEIAELRKEDAELKQLANTEDHTEFLLSYSPQTNLSESTDASSIKIRPVTYFEDVSAALSEARDKVQDILGEEWSRVSQRVRSVDVLLPEAEPKTREEFLKYSFQVTLDPNTAHSDLTLCDRDRRVAERFASELSSSNRFSENEQVLSKDSLPGRSYWEVEWSGKGVSVAVAYRKKHERQWKIDHESGFGNSDKSWALDCSKKGYKFKHNKVITPISGPQSSRVGVYLDTRAGILAFYSVSDAMTLLHTVQTTFTQPLHAGIRMWSNFWDETTAKFIKIE